MTGGFSTLATHLSEADVSEVRVAAKTLALRRLEALVADCAELEEAQAGALRIGSPTVQVAEAVVIAMPEWFPSPEFAVEPDGSISIDWIRSHQRMFSISVGITRTLAYAWLDGAERGHGVARFDDAVLPECVVSGIRRIMS